MRRRECYELYISIEIRLDALISVHSQTCPTYTQYRQIEKKPSIMRLSILVASMWLWSTVFAAAMNQPRSNSKSGDGSKLTSKELECSHRFHDSQEIKGSHWRKLCCKQSEVSEKEQQREALDEHVRALSQGYDGLQHPNPLLSMIFPGPCVSCMSIFGLSFLAYARCSARSR